MTDAPVYVVVSGPPASGKTTLARALARELALPLVAKDTIKEALMSVLGAPDVEASRRLGRAAVAAMLAVAAEATQGAVIDCNFRRSAAVGELRRLPGTVVEVFCRCDRDVAVRRYHERAGSRHAGHFDSVRSPAELWTDEVIRPVAGGWRVVEVSTGRPVDVAGVVGAVRGAHGGAQHDRPEAPPDDVWVDARVAVRPSTIHGHGLVAIDGIAAGTVVWRLGGRLVPSAALADLLAAAEADPAAPYVDTVTVHEDAHLVLPPSTVLHFGNHSCDPSVWQVGPYEFATRREVRPGDELTVDYGTISGAAGFTMACGCGSSLCRRALSSDDWRRPELHERYGDHWAPALLDRIDRLGDEC